VGCIARRPVAQRRKYIVEKQVDALEDACTRLRDKIPIPEEDPTQGMDDRDYRRISNRIPNELQLRMTLKWIWQKDSITRNELLQILTVSGFENPDSKLIEPILANKTLVESSGDEIWIKADARKVLARLFQKCLC